MPDERGRGLYWQERAVLSLVAAIETGDKTGALDAFIDQIQNRFDLQMEMLDRTRQTAPS